MDLRNSFLFHRRLQRHGQCASALSDAPMLMEAPPAPTPPVVATIFSGHHNPLHAALETASQNPHESTQQLPWHQGTGRNNPLNEAVQIASGFTHQPTGTVPGNTSERNGVGTGNPDWWDPEFDNWITFPEDEQPTSNAAQQEPSSSTPAPNPGNDVIPQSGINASDGVDMSDIFAPTENPDLEYAKQLADWQVIYLEFKAPPFPPAPSGPTYNSWVSAHILEEDPDYRQFIGGQLPKVCAFQNNTREGSPSNFASGNSGEAMDVDCSGTGPRGDEVVLSSEGPEQQGVQYPPVQSMQGSHAFQHPREYGQQISSPSTHTMTAPSMSNSMMSLPARGEFSSPVPASMTTIAPQQVFNAASPGHSSTSLMQRATFTPPYSPEREFSVPPFSSARYQSPSLAGPTRLPTPIPDHQQTHGFQPPPFQSGPVNPGQSQIKQSPNPKTAADYLGYKSGRYYRKYAIPRGLQRILSQTAVVQMAAAEGRPPPFITDADVDQYFKAQRSRPTHALQSFSTPANVDIRLLGNIRITAAEIMAFFPNHTKWHDARYRLGQNGWSSAEITAYMNYTRQLPKDAAVRSGTMQDRLRTADREILGQDHSGIRLRFRTVFFTAKTWKFPVLQGYEAHPIDYFLVDLAEGVVHMPTGKGAGLLTRAIMLAAQEGMNYIRLSDTEEFIRDTRIREHALEPMARMGLYQGHHPDAWVKLEVGGLIGRGSRSVSESVSEA